MSPKPQFEELDFRKTSMGDLSLRRRTILALDNREIFEIILGDAYLMSSLFTVVEEELSRIGLEATEGDHLDVVVGGLGLGYTAVAALESPRLQTLRVIDFLQPVIDWHQSQLLPLGAQLKADSRCQLVHGDFFEMAQTSFDLDQADRKYHAVLLDIDHSPEKLLRDSNATLYTEEGLQNLANQIHPGGVFAMWSDDPPNQWFIDELQKVFKSVESHIVTFESPLQDREFASTVYVAKRVLAI